jgi:hypothetical protein
MPSFASVGRDRPLLLQVTVSSANWIVITLKDQPQAWELVDEVLFQLWPQRPPSPVDPELELEKLVAFCGCLGATDPLFGRAALNTDRWSNQVFQPAP